MLSHQLIKIDTKSEHIPFEGPPTREPGRESIPVSDTSAYCIFWICSSPRCEIGRASIGGGISLFSFRIFK